MSVNIKLRDNEAGYVLAFVLILVLMVGIVIVPLLLFMSSGIMSSERHEEWTSEYYAADAGIEDAAHKILYDYEYLPSYVTPLEYTITDINGCNVTVVMEKVWILKDLEEPSTQQGKNLNDALMTIGQITELEGGTGTYWIEMTYDDSLVQDLMVDKVGAWLPAGFAYVTGSSTGITSAAEVPDNPTQTPFRGGTALEWEFTTPVKFEDLPPLGGGGGTAEFPIKRVLYFEFTPAVEPNGAFCWMRTTADDPYLSWDSASGLYKVTSTAVNQETGEDITLEAYMGGSQFYETMGESYGDYRAIGQSLMEDTNNPPDHYRETLLYHFTDVSAEITDIPAGATIELAYLYWSAWRRSPNDIRSYSEGQLADLADEIDEARFGTEQSDEIWVNQWVSADRTQISSSEYSGWSFSCRADVTDLIGALDEPNAQYKVERIAHIDDRNGMWYEHYEDDYYWATDHELSYAGWSLVIVYSHPDENANQLYLYDDFLHMDQYTTQIFPIKGFLVPELGTEDEGGRLTYFVGEGDEHYGDKQRRPRWRDIDSARLDGKYYLSDADNPKYNVMNGISSGLYGEEIDGLDIDTFDITDYVVQGQNEAELELRTGYDIWNLIYVIISFRTEPGTNPTTLPVGILTYTYQ